MNWGGGPMKRMNEVKSVCMGAEYSLPRRHGMGQGEQKRMLEDLTDDSEFLEYFHYQVLCSNEVGPVIQNREDLEGQQIKQKDRWRVSRVTEQELQSQNWGDQPIQIERDQKELDGFQLEKGTKYTVQSPIKQQEPQNQSQQHQEIANEPDSV